MLTVSMLNCAKKRKRDKKSGPRGIVTELKSVVKDRIRTMKCQRMLYPPRQDTELWHQTLNREQGNLKWGEGG